MGTYATLQIDIPAWLEDHSEELVEQVPNIIAFAENRCAKELQIRQFNWQLAGTMSAGGSNYPFPGDMQAMREFEIALPEGGTVILKRRMRDWLKVYWPNSAEVGVPRYYAVDDDATFIVAPTPGFAYPYVQRYRRQLQKLSNDNQTNWLTENAYDALLYCCLAEGAKFLLSDRRDNLAESYEAKWAEKRDSINGSEARVMRDEDRQPTTLQANV